VGSPFTGLTYGCGTIYKATHGSGEAWTTTILYEFVREGGTAKYPSGEPLLSDANPFATVTAARVRLVSVLVYP